MRWLRFRVRMLLILVLLSGLGMGGVAPWRRSAEFRVKADACAWWEATWEAPPPLNAQYHYFRDLRIKYRRAARYPFLPVAPDPPVPE